MAEPVRTCVGCRRRRPQRELLRFQVDPEGRLVPVVRAGRGRSAYLCPDFRCFRQAVRRRAFERSLHRPVAVGPAEELARRALGAVLARMEVLERSAPGHPDAERLRELARRLAEGLGEKG